MFYAVFDNSVPKSDLLCFGAVRQFIYKTAGIFYESSGGKNMLNMKKRNCQAEKSARRFRFEYQFSIFGLGYLR